MIIDLKIKKQMKWDQESIVVKFREVQGYVYDYSKFVYVNIDTKGIIICKEHGEFSQTAYQHIYRKNICPKCALIKRTKSRTKPFSSFLVKAIKKFGNTFIYNESTFINTNTKTLINCKVHGDFWQEPFLHLVVKYGCPECSLIGRGNIRRKTHEEFLKDAFDKHGDEFEYLDQYELAIKKMRIRHKKCGKVFNRNPNNHLNNHKLSGCPFCRAFLGHKKIVAVLNNRKKFDIEKSFPDCKNKRKLLFDFCVYDDLGNIECLIEYDGVQHFRPKYFDNYSYEKSVKNFLYIVNNDNIKNDYCKKNNIKLIRIPYWNLVDIKEILTKELNLE